MPSFSEQVYQKAMRLLHQKGVMNPEIMDDKQIRSMVNEYTSILNTAVSPAISKGVESGIISAEMKRHLDNDVYLFSGFKTYHELKDASAMLRDDNGQLKPFNRFYNDITAIKQDYNKNWLQSEYIFATQSSVMAAKWKEQEADDDRYNLQYRTAGDSRVRPEHAALNRTTLPASDPFWNEYYPPNGWRCRCTVVQVRKGKYPETDSSTAMQQGREATYEAGKNGTNKAAIFRFNPGKQQVIFPPHHPYYQVSESLRTKIEEDLQRNNVEDIKDKEGLKDFIVSMAKNDWFVRPLEHIEKEKNRNSNGSTNMKGTIYLKETILKDCIDSINNIKNGKENSFEQERSMATLWHEITHNRNKPGIMFTTTLQRRFMELANEFVARNTLPEFFEALGGNLKNKILMENRENTGYNGWVMAYQKLIDNYGLDKQEVVSYVKGYLFNEQYDKQKNGLVNALFKAGKGKISKSEAQSKVKTCLSRY